MNNWINFVKEYAAENGLSYKEAMKEAKDHYQSGGSVKSNFVRNIIYKDSFDPRKMKGKVKSNNISTNIKIKATQKVSNVEKKEPKESKKPFRKQLQEKGIFLDADIIDDEEHIIDKYYETNALDIYKSFAEL